MVHHFALQQSNPRYLDGFETFMLDRRHNSLPPNHLLVGLQLNVRKVKLYNFVIAKDAHLQLLDDVAPYNNGGAEFKDKIVLASIALRKMFSLKPVPKSKSKRAFANPEYRDFLNIFVIGCKEVEKEGVTMQHNYVVIEGQRKYVNGYLDWMETRKYTTQLPNIPGQHTIPEIREIRLIDFSTMTSCQGQLMYDLSPFEHIETDRPWWFKQAVKLGRKIFGLKPPHPASRVTPEHIPDFRKHVEVRLLASKSDASFRDPDFDLRPIAEMV